MCSPCPPSRSHRWPWLMVTRGRTSSRSGLGWCSTHWVLGCDTRPYFWSCCFSLSFCVAIFVYPDKFSVGKRKRSEDEEVPTAVEMAENTDNPLRCPVRLYEFYLSKWWVTELEFWSVCRLKQAFGQGAHSDLLCLCFPNPSVGAEQGFQQQHCSETPKQLFILLVTHVESRTEIQREVCSLNK